MKSKLFPLSYPIRKSLLEVFIHPDQGGFLPHQEVQRQGLCYNKKSLPQQVAECMVCSLITLIKPHNLSCTSMNNETIAFLPKGAIFRITWTGDRRDFILFISSAQERPCTVSCQTMAKTVLEIAFAVAEWNSLSFQRYFIQVIFIVLILKIGD